MMKDEQLYIPRQAFLYFPPASLAKVVHQKYSVRHIFQAGVAFDEEQVQAIRETRRAIRQEGLQLSEYWAQDSNLLRFIYACKFSPRKCIKTIQKHEELRRLYLPVREDRQVLQAMNTGAIYLAGRDHYFRPLIVIDATNVGGIEEEVMVRGVAFFFEFVLGQVMQEGQVENWFVLINIGGQSLLALKEAVSGVVDYLMNMYRSRLVCTIVINCTFAVDLFWRGIRLLLDDRTADKFELTREARCDRLFQYFHPSQIERKFGGTHPDILKGQYFPPRPFSDQYHLDSLPPPSLISPAEYVRKYSHNQLAGFKVCESILQEQRHKDQLQSKQQQEQRLKVQSNQQAAVPVESPAKQNLPRRGRLKRERARGRLEEVLRLEVSSQSLMGRVQEPLARGEGY